MGQEKQFKTTLVIGDAHISEGQELSRFIKAGKLIADQQPDNVVIIGDFLSFNCFSEWDRNKRRKMEGRRYELEIKAGNEALNNLIKPSVDHNVLMRKRKKPLYVPRSFYIEGNHENWQERYLDHDPTFAGQIDYVRDLGLRGRGFDHYRYKDRAVIDGVSFTHVPIDGRGKPIGEPNSTRKATNIYSGSVAYGHTHAVGYQLVRKTDSTRDQYILNVGCFFEHTDNYAAGAKNDYWRGLVLMHHYGDGEFDIETINIKRLNSLYG